MQPAVIALAMHIQYKYKLPYTYIPATLYNVYEGCWNILFY